VFRIFILKDLAVSADTPPKQSGFKGASRLNPTQRIEMPSNLNAGSAGSRPPGGNPVPLEDAHLGREASEDLLGAESALRDLPAARAVMVRRAQRLVLDPDYPPREALDQIARLFALRWPRE